MTAAPASGRPRIELVTTDGIFALDGGEWEVTNNIWLVGDDRSVMVIDAAHDHVSIVEAIAGRRVAAIACTHGHNDHINAAVALSEAVDAPVWLDPGGRIYSSRAFRPRKPIRVGLSGSGGSQYGPTSSASFRIDSAQPRVLTDSSGVSRLSSAHPSKTSAKAII